MLNNLLKYAQNYHRIVVILTTTMLLSLLVEKAFYFSGIYFYSIPQFLSHVAHLLFGADVFLFFYLIIGFFSKSVTNVYLKTIFLLATIILALVTSYVVDVYLIFQCPDSGCADQWLEAEFWNIIGTFIMLSYTCQKSTAP